VVSKVTVSNYKAFEKNTLRAFFTATLPDGLIIHNLSLHEKNGGRWIGMPSEKFTDREGKTGYKKLIEFSDRVALDAFRDACLDAIDGVRAPSSQSSQPTSRTADAPNPWDAQPTTQQSRGSHAAATQKQNRTPPPAERQDKAAASYQADDSDIPF
jgi:DNA-binding cell septation regulator SpoVG